MFRTKYIPLILLLSLLGCTHSESAKFVQNKTQIEQARFNTNLISVGLVLPSDNTLRFYTDTGGGNSIYYKTVDLLNLTIDTVWVEGRKMEQVNINPLLTNNDVPETIKPLFVQRSENYLNESYDGMLGTLWFADKIWEFRYKEQQLFVMDSLNWGSVNDLRVINLGFLKNETAENATHFPRIPITVGKDTLQMLFDTGARAILSEEAKQVLGNHETVATSFIIASVFDKWRSNNPDWKVIEAGDLHSNQDMIRVPEVSVGNHTVGPVWFTRRDDYNFTEFMSQWMDQKVEGAIGGSFFKYFESIIIDYNEGKAYFDS